MVYCLKNANPGLPSDRWYQKEPALEFANQCALFVEGEGIHCYVEDDDDDILIDLDPEMKALMIRFLKEDDE